MSELISREAVQREIQASFDGGALRWQDGQDLMDRINAIPAAPRWHRVEEELPEIGQIVLVYDEWRRLSICQLDNSYRWLRQGGGWFNGPCACYWMPIEPPKEG